MKWIARGAIAILALALLAPAVMAQEEHGEFGVYADFAFYPGGGIELFAKWIGIRAEVGDQMYWENGANHNLKFSVGPQFRW